MSSTNWDYEQTAPPLNDEKVDRLADVPPGQLDELATLAIDIPDHQIIRNLENRIQDSVGYWNDPGGYNLRVARGDNMRLYLGKQLDVRSLYRFQIPYIENQIYVAEQAILAYLTAQNPQPEVSPAQNNPRSKVFAAELEKTCAAHGLKVGLQQILESTVRNALNKRLGIIYFEFVPDMGKNGEIVPRALNPEEVIIDKNARQGENPAFISRQLKMSVNEACSRWPRKREEIFQELGIVRGTYKQMESILNVRQVWLTYYDSEYKAQEAVVYYFGKVVLEKAKNPNWLHATPEKNFIDAPKKPFLALNFDNDGQHWVDQTSAVEQAGNIQNILNKRGRQYMEIVDKANGILVIDTRSGITKADSQDLTGDPNQHIVIAGQPGVNNQELVFRLPPPQIPRDLLQDKIDARTTIHAIMGTPSEFSGSNDGDADPQTLGEAEMKKNQAAGRQDLYVRAIDRLMDNYFEFLVQMMVVWYTDKHYFVYNGGDGEFDYLTMSRDLFEDGVAISVKGGTTLPFDKRREEAIALALIKHGEMISPLDAYKMLHMQNPQQLYDNWAKYKTDPMSLARDALDELDEAKAYVAYVEIMAGKKPEDPDDCSKEFVLSLRKLMLRDEFLKANRKYQQAFIKFTKKALDSLELRTGLDEMSRQGLQSLDPNVPIQPPQAPQMPMVPAAPGMAPGGASPGMGTPPQAPPLLGGPMGAPQPAGPTPLPQPTIPNIPMGAFSGGLNVA